ncbi:hypothetical protein [Kribbella albertanoniae]|nr:hypothetical protein [Kribbella albertanoniae]
MPAVRRPLTAIAIRTVGSLDASHRAAILAGIQLDAANPRKDRT